MRMAIRKDTNTLDRLLHCNHFPDGVRMGKGRDILKGDLGNLRGSWHSNRYTQLKMVSSRVFSFGFPTALWIVKDGKN